jgi:hypothetical protein
LGVLALILAVLGSVGDWMQPPATRLEAPAETIKKVAILPGT